MRQNIHIANPLSSLSSQPSQPVEVSLDFPLFRKQVKSDNWRTDFTITRIADAHGSSVSLHYIKGLHHDQETVELTQGVEKIDTGNLELTRGTGQYASSEQEFSQLVALATNLLANITSEVGPVPPEAAESLISAASRVKNNGRTLERAMRQ